MLAIATVAGGKWPGAGASGCAQGVAADIDDASLLELLLGDIRDMFRQAGGEQDRAGGPDTVRSHWSRRSPRRMDGRGASLERAEKPLTQNKLARLLKQLKIVPDSVRIDEKRTPKGYYLHQFEEAFARYLP